MIDPSTREIERAYRVRLRPTEAQARVLRRLFGARRFVWNWALQLDRTLRAAGERSGVTAWSAAFTALKRAPETAWLSELPREPFNQTLRDFDRAKTNFFAGRARPPRRKKRGTIQSTRFTLDQRRAQVDREAGSVQLDGIGRLRLKVTEPLLGRLRSVTVSVDSAGRWFACFTADGVSAPVAAPASLDVLGIDLGLRQTATCSDGTVHAAARPLAKKQARLRRYQRRQSRQLEAQMRAQGLDPAKPCPKGTRLATSNRRRRVQQQIGRLHAQIADARRDHLHQVSAAAVAKAQVLVIEDLAVKGMGRTLRRGFRRSVADAGLGELGRQLSYKAGWQGRMLVKVDRWFPSSKTCSACGLIHASLKLGQSTWICEGCGARHDRDANAALNIEREGLRLLAQGPAESTAPDGGRARSARTDARGEGACAIGRTPPIGQPTSAKRERDYRAASRRPRSGARDGPRATGREG